MVPSTVQEVYRGQDGKSQHAIAAEGLASTICLEELKMTATTWWCTRYAGGGVCQESNVLHNAMWGECEGRLIIQAALGLAWLGRQGDWDQPGFENVGGK